MPENSKAKICRKFKTSWNISRSWKTFVCQNARNKSAKKKQTKAIAKIDTKGEKSFLLWKLKMKMSKFIIHYNRKMEIIYLPGAFECVWLFRIHSPFVSYCIELLCDIIKRLLSFIFALKSDLYQSCFQKHFSHYPSFHFLLFVNSKGRDGFLLSWLSGTSLNRFLWLFL